MGCEAVRRSPSREVKAINEMERGYSVKSLCENQSREGGELQHHWEDCFSVILNIPGAPLESNLVPPYFGGFLKAQARSVPLVSLALGPFFFFFPQSGLHRFAILVG
jgi:hypothetical protein